MLQRRREEALGLSSGDPEDSGGRGRGVPARPQNGSNTILVPFFEEKDTEQTKKYKGLVSTYVTMTDGQSGLL